MTYRVTPLPEHLPINSVVTRRQLGLISVPL